MNPIHPRTCHRNGKTKWKEETEAGNRNEKRKRVPHFSPKWREVGTRQITKMGHRNGPRNIVIPTGASVFHGEGEAEWKTLCF